MKIVITDFGFANIVQETATITEAGFELVTAQCKTAEDVIYAAADADGILVQWAPITAAVIQSLSRCKVIVRYGIGLDNVDLSAARQKGIPVCNVPDYCIDEVADHTVALALAQARQLVQIDRRRMHARILNLRWQNMLKPRRHQPVNPVGFLAWG